MIKLKWLGHSCFRVECRGYALVLDPFEPGSVPGCRDIHETANEVLCSHEHHDHNYRAGITLLPGESPFHLQVVESWHDDCQGAKRGPNRIHVLEADGLRVAHFGDIGCVPTSEQLSLLQGLDAALLPVGGFYTVGPEEARAIVDAIRPRVVIPMHYRKDSPGGFGFDVLGPLEDFLALCGDWKQLPGDTIELGTDMQPGTVVLRYQG